MNVLIACEESQTLCIEFRKLGHNAYSCDIQACSGGFPGISKAFATQYSAAILFGVNYSLPVQLSLFDWS